HGDEASEATGTYTPAVALPPAPAAPALASSGAAGTAQRTTVTVPDDTDVTLLDAAGNATATVAAGGQGRYDLDGATGTISFRPAAGFTGRAHGVRYRLTDAYGQASIGGYSPTVVATPVAPPVPLRVTT